MDATSRRMCLAFRWYDYVLLSAIFFYLFILVMNMPIFYDEAYNLQVPIMLLREHEYDTIYHTRLFDGFTTITTGPTVLVPTFLVFKFFGIGVLRARIVQYVYVVALLGLLWGQFVKHYDRFIGIALLLILYSIPQLSMMLSVLGEFPAIFFVFFGITLWGRGSHRYQYIAILVMGFSVITKLYFGFILFPLLALITIRAIQTKKPMGNFVKEVLVTSFLFLLPFVLGEMIKFVYLGNISYARYLSELLQYIDTQQIDFGSELTSQFPITPLAKFTTFSYGMFPGSPWWITLIIICGVTITSVEKIIHGINDENMIFSLSFLIFTTYLLWFVFVDSNDWWRHISPFSILFLFLLGDLINSIVKLFRHPAAKYITILVLCLGLGSYILPFVVNSV